MKYPKFKLNIDWELETEFAGIKNKTIIFSKGQIFEANENGEYIIEWFGGKVNASNVVVWNCGDDGIDTDQSWGGTLDNFVVITTAGHCFELDGPEGSYSAGHIIKNGNIMSSGDIVSEDLINVDDNSIVELKNLTFTSVVEGQKINRVTAPLVSFENIQIDVTDISLHVNGAVPNGVSVGNTPRANTQVLNWTWASQAGQL